MRTAAMLVGEVTLSCLVEKVALQLSATAITSATPAFSGLA
jgi:hypothetical protein